ncbi:glycosyltransferase family 9 protein [Thalassobaculum sp. OXR-137]|uniref:glycosyltransferase family 9 protein n=1 Tax=Thalassobaculum sp. OXR-137 TaxID=3100173 RepID=UPI002AC9A726|nr:glycosyltransferase family 9 protein [Thalassobaculum sp. OXR-137]WPZ35748.1 glycosyltransferase family 9 protein [Thalassobaculum sp. OXR-137]
MTDAAAMERVLVIKLGALGDFLLALGPMQAIRRAHPAARLTLLTRTAYRGLAEASGLFDTIWIDPAPKLNPLAWLALRQKLRGGRFQRVYDLQTSDRSAAYFRLMGGAGGPQWSGKVPGCSHRHVYQAPSPLHTVDRQREQLAVAGITDVPLSDLSFLDAPIADRLPARPFALLIPGASPGRPAKRWPADRFGALASRLDARGLGSVVAGTDGESGLAHAIQAQAPEALDLTGATSLADLAAVARAARLVIGNDTGPTHLAALAGAPTLALFSADSDPGRTGPRGPHTRWLQRDDLADLDEAAVLAAIGDWVTDDPRLTGDLTGADAPGR